MLKQMRQLTYAIWSFLFYINPNDSARMATWRDQDIADMQNTPGINVDLIGKLIGTGMQHRIYQYNDTVPMVLKVSTSIPFLRFPTLDESNADVEYIRRYFAPYLIEPVEIVPLRKGTYVIKQRRLAAFRVVTPAELRDENVRKQFVDVVARNQKMMREVGRSLDYLGREGQRKCRAALIGLSKTPTIANVIIEQPETGTAQVRIIDTDLENFHPDAKTWRDQQSAFAGRIALNVNRFLIQQFFKIDVAG